MDRSYAQCFNILGLFVSALGAALLILFTSPGLDVTETGEVLGMWKNEKMLPEQRAANVRKYVRHKYGFRGGVVLLTLGYTLQLFAAVFG